MLQQQQEYLERLDLKLQADTVLAHFACTHIHIEGIKPHTSGSVANFHLGLPAPDWRESTTNDLPPM
jgi:hypothetical protein